MQRSPRSASPALQLRPHRSLNQRRNCNYAYGGKQQDPLSQMDHRDDSVLYTEVDDPCDELTAVDRRRYCQLIVDRRRSSLSHRVSTFVELS